MSCKKAEVCRLLGTSGLLRALAPVEAAAVSHGAQCVSCRQEGVSRIGGSRQHRRPLGSWSREGGVSTSLIWRLGPFWSFLGARVGGADVSGMAQFETCGQQMCEMQNHELDEMIFWKRWAMSPSPYGLSKDAQSTCLNIFSPMYQPQSHSVLGNRIPVSSAV